jgi:hypothetical protein
VCVQAGAGNLHHHHHHVTNQAIAWLVTLPKSLHEKQLEAIRHLGDATWRACRAVDWQRAGFSLWCLKYLTVLLLQQSVKKRLNS